MHAFLSNLANRQTDKRKRAKTCTCSFVGGNNKKCGRRVRPTRYAPARLQWHRYSILFPEWRRDRDETYRRVRRSLDTDSIKTLVHAFVMSRVDYCNAVFAVSLTYIYWYQHEDQKCTTGFVQTTASVVSVNVFRNTFAPLCGNFRLYLKEARTNYEYKHRGH